MSSHPVHAIFVHLPIAFFTTAYGIDALRPVLTQLPASVLEFLPPSADLTSYYALSVRLLTAVPALATGILQADSVLKTVGDIYQKDKKTLKPKVKLMYTHAALNDGVILLIIGYWWIRRQAGGSTYESEWWMVVFGAILGGILVAASGLGAKLVFNHGTGMAISRGKQQ